MLAAIRAAQMGARVELLERGPRLGRKLRITGKGRCNITNTADIRGFIEAFEPNGKFLFGAFSRFSNDDLQELLHGLGLETKVERGGRVFPATDSAGDVAETLEQCLRSLGVNIRLNTRVRSLVVEDAGVRGVRTYSGVVPAGAAVLATGGVSYPRTGSTGDGFRIAAELGHTIVPLSPALSPLVTQDPWIPKLQGLALKNVKATLIQANADGSEKQISSEFGEMLFTHFGVSGPIILTLSRQANRLIGHSPLLISLDLKPGLSAEDLHRKFIRDFRGSRSLGVYLRGLLPRLLAELFPALAGVPASTALHSVTVQDRERIVKTLKDLRITVSGAPPIEEAIVTSGGVCTREIDPRTMMSKIVAGLFFAGEVMDIDAVTGGFNLQAAFSTGWAAGESAAKFACENGRA